MRKVSKEEKGKVSWFPTKDSKSNMKRALKMQAIDEKIKRSTVDEEEIEHFKKHAQRWWGVFTGLHRMNQIRVPLVKEGLARNANNADRPFDNKLILEIGCGGGILSEELAKIGGNVHGIDPQSEVISVAKIHASLNPELSNLTYSNETIEQHAAHNYEKYDAIVASEVLEHVTEKELFLEAAIKCLKPGGSIFITTFNKTMRSWIVCILIVQEILNFIPKGTHTWDKFISPEDVTTMLEKFNCKIVEVKGMDFHFFTKKWSWSNNLSTNYSLQAIKKIN